MSWCTGRRMSRGLDRPCRLHRLLYRNLHLRLFLRLIIIFFLVIDVPVLFAHRIGKQKISLGQAGKASEIREEKNIRAMAHKNDYQIQKQLDKPQTWFCKYYPARIRNVGEKEIADRQLVFDFKDGRAYEEVAQRTAENMLTLYGKGCVNIVFAPVPASTSESNELRYKAFCHRVCELTGAENGYEHVRVCGERKTIHDNRKNEDEVRKANVVEFDEPFFDNKMVLVFDDVITKGLSYAKYANQLERLGACVIGGMFLARTHYKVR